MPPEGKSGGSLNMISMVWLVERLGSVSRRSVQVMLILRSGISISARTASSGGLPVPGDIASVRQTTEPTERLPWGSFGSSSYSTTRWATAAPSCAACGWLGLPPGSIRSGILGFDAGWLLTGATSTGGAHSMS